jgi:hypothetical protein
MSYGKNNLFLNEHGNNKFENIPDLISKTSLPKK